MKKILIISPHFPPSNLTAVHRARFFSEYLPDFGWEPIILTVHEKHYEEDLDHNLEKMLPEKLRIEKVKAFGLTKPRVIGDIGLRGFNAIFKRAKELIIAEKIDFLYIIIPSFYGALWGRKLARATGIKFGIDYIDPWVHEFPGSNNLFSRHWFATKLSRLLEPIAVKNASLISGVADSYYADVIERNPGLKDKCQFVTIPPGGDKRDFTKISELNIMPYLFKKNHEKIQLIYAGAMLPKAYQLLEKVFIAIASSLEISEKLEIHFIGTGKTATDPSGFNIKLLAQKYGLWKKQVFEYPQRIPYLDVLVHLNASTGVFILGSTEAHYTPSKVYQAVLSERPVFAILHKDSSAVKVLKNSNAGIVLEFFTEQEVADLDKSFVEYYLRYIDFIGNFDKMKIDHEDFKQYSAKEITRILAEHLDRITSSS